MGRPKKTEAKIIPDAPLLDVDAEAPVIAQQRHRIVTEYVKAVPVDDVSDDADEAEDYETTEQTPPIPDDPIERLLRDIGASTSNWMLVVDRLPNYQRDGMSHSRVKFVRCGMFALTPELLQGEAYIEEIQTRWARPNKANDFRLCVRRDSRIYAYLPVLTLEPPDPEVLAKVAANEQPQFNFNLPQTADSFDSFIKQAEKMAKLRDAMGWSAPTHQPAQQNPAQQPLTTEAALLHLVSADESLLDKAVGSLSKLFRRGEDFVREIGFLDIAFEAIKNNTLPQLVREFRAMMIEGAQINGQTQIHPQTVSLGAVGGVADVDRQSVTQSTPGIQPSSAASAEGRLAQTDSPADRPTGSGFPPEIQLLNFAVGACAQNMPIAGAVVWINTFEDRNPSVGPFIESFLSITPNEALQWLAAVIPQAQPIAHAPHAKQWIAELQTGLRGEEEVTDGDGPNSPA